jgi:hypothetical protein
MESVIIQDMIWNMALSIIKMEKNQIRPDGRSHVIDWTIIYDIRRGM